MPSIGAIFDGVTFFTPPAPPPTVTAANSGVSLSGTTVQLGQAFGAVGNPAALLHNTEIPMAGRLIGLSTTAAQTLLSFPAIQPAFPQGDFLISHNSVAFPGGADEIVNLGFNLSPSNTQVVPGVAAIGLSIEGSFQPGVGQYLQEFHLIQLKPAGTQVRMLSVTADANSNNIDAFFSCNTFEWKTSDGAGNVWADFSGGGTTAVAFRLRGSGGTRLEMGYTEAFGTSTFGISTTAGGSPELHLDASWAFVFLPAFYSNAAVNNFQADALPNIDGGYRSGSQNFRWSFVDGINGRFNVILAGDFSANQTPTAKLHINLASTGAANTAPIKLPLTGTLLATPENATIETDGTTLYFTSGGTRKTIFIGNDAAAAPGTTAGVVITNFYGTSATNFLGDPNSWAQVIINGTTYKIPLYT